jgi:hypothetical protein
MDLVFFLKAAPTAADRALPWPRPTELLGIDPTEHRCEGADPRCSSAYTRLWHALRDPATGRVMPNLLARYAKGRQVDRVAFVGFSAAHGLLDPLVTHPADRAAISAYILLDATFGGGKAGYKAMASDAAAGRTLLVTATSNTGGDAAWRLVWDDVVARTGRRPSQIAARPPMPPPSGGAWRLGDDLFYYRYVNAQGGTELPHWEMGKLQNAILAAHLVPYWGERSHLLWYGLAATATGGYLGYRLIKRRRAS